MHKGHGGRLQAEWGRSDPRKREIVVMDHGWNTSLAEELWNGWQLSHMVMFLLIRYSSYGEHLALRSNRHFSAMTPTQVDFGCLCLSAPVTRVA